MTTRDNKKHKPVDEELDSSMTAPAQQKKIDYAQPESIEEAINDLQTFLECDLYTKFRPENKLPTGKNNKLETWYRKDFFKNEKQFVEYLNDHFNILRKEIKSLKKNERNK